MSTGSSLQLLVKLIIHISLLLHLWQLGRPESKFQIAAQSLPKVEVDTLNDLSNKLGRKQPFQFSASLCNDEKSVFAAGISCDCTYDNNTTCHVKTLSWSDHSLTGRIPEVVANLTHLEKLDLSGNELHGAIPPILGMMTNLYELDLSNNQLTEVIPASLGHLKAQAQIRSNNLRLSRMTGTHRFFKLDLSRNHLNGSIPESLGNIKMDLTRIGGKNTGPRSIYDSSISLVSIDLSYNQLSGVIPASLRHLTFLQFLDLGYNLLSGPIPASFGSMSSLRELDVSNNQLTGSLPPQIANLSSLYSLDVSNNQLFGSLPTEIGNLSSLYSLWLSSNNFTGRLPDSYAQLKSLRQFSISGNYLSGPFPNFITNWSAPFETLLLGGNNYGGYISPEIFNIRPRRLIITDVADTCFQLPLSAEHPYYVDKSVSTLVLRNCSITGEIPTSIGNMPSLRYLDLSFNKLTGGIPDSLRNVNLTYMSLSGNMLTGTIPDWIPVASRSTQIDLSYNSLSDLSNNYQRNSNLSLFSCCTTETASTTANINHLSMKFCPEGKPKYHSLFINCGGEEVPIGGHSYDRDNTATHFYLSPKGNWAYTSPQTFISSKRGKFVSEAPLYGSARFAPLSLKYYGLCLQNGRYSVKLHFTDFVSMEDASYNNLNKRIFDVYIQGRLVLKDFNIADAAGGPNKVVVEYFLAVPVSENRLEIHFYWAGKGSSDYRKDVKFSHFGPPPKFNGPLISAISVTPEFKLGKKLSPIHIALITIASVIFAMLLLLAFAWMTGWLVDKEELYEITVGEDKTVTLKQLRNATQTFSKDMEIGKGGFGTVYRAELPDHHIVAVKKLSTLSEEGIDKLKSEIYTLQSLRHDNLVRLFDIYVGKGLYLLIYEHMENKSLADVLFDPEHKVRLEWDARFNICLGIAKGLEYLHEHPRFKMVHRGIKAANILLDGTFKSKISDFGLASSYAESDNDAIRVVKTETQHGYMAPEYPMYGTISSKYDVYGFGVVILELVSGRKNAGHKSNHELGFLVDEVCVADTKGRLLDLVDQSLTVYETKQAITILKLAVKCTNISPGVRPTMSQVVSVLTEEKTLEEISMPATSVEAEKIEHDLMEDLAKDATSVEAEKIEHDLMEDLAKDAESSASA